MRPTRSNSGGNARPGDLVLRTAAVWGTYVLASRDLVSGQSLRLGEGDDALVAKPEASPAAELPIRAAGSGWELDARGATGGVLHLRGRQENPTALAAAGAPLPIVAGDYGVLQYGSLSVFFQFSEAAPVPRSRWRPDFSLWLSFFFALLTVGGSLALLYLLYPQQDLAKPLELTSPEELEVRYSFSPPPEPSTNEESDGESGEPAKAPERKAAPAPTPRRPRSPAPPASDPSTAKPGLSAMTDVLQGAVGKEVLDTLGTIGSVSAALGGLDRSGVVLGGHSAGAGLRGTGSGASRGGKAAFGAGTLKTGGGAGGRAGRGKGKGRASGPGGGGAERRLAVKDAPKPGQGLSPSQISRVVRSRSGAFRACYESAAARNPGLSGGVTVAFNVATSGSVTARVAKSSLGNARVESCVLRAFKRLRFPKADKPTSANWPLVFRASKK